MSVHVDIKKRLASFTLEVALDAGSETLGLLGASGSGKSMTLRCIAGIETPDEGIIQVNGTTFFDKPAGARHAKVNLKPQERKTALLFQNYQLFPNLSVFDNVAAGIDRSLDARTRQDIVMREIERFSLKGLEARYPYHLSGGQQQRVALARMFASKPGILMLDEPFSALDVHLKSGLEQNLVGVFDQFNGTILYVSHDIDEAFRFCKRIAVIDNGKIDEVSEKDDLVQHPRSLATLKLSGCKNTTPATKTNSHEVFLPEWGIRVHVADLVSDDVKYLGVRAFDLKLAAGPGKTPNDNVFHVRADRISDSRFERAIMMTVLDIEGQEARSARDSQNPNKAHFLKSRIQWAIDKTHYDLSKLPVEGEDFYIRIPDNCVNLVSK